MPRAVEESVTKELEAARRRAALGKQPPALDELRRIFPTKLGYEVHSGEHVEFVEGRLRVIPIAQVESPDGRTVVFYPEMNPSFRGAVRRQP
jgi:hypothetical protein